MQALSDGIEEGTASRTNERGESEPCRLSIDEAEQRYRSARNRLLDAQQEKTEATVEFIAARAALRRVLEALWPEPDDCETLGVTGAGR